MRATLVSLRPTQAATDAHRPALTPELLAATGEENAKAYWIYALCDPRDASIRYIGITTQRVQKRLNAHLRLAREGRQLHCSNWLRQLQQEGLRPQIKVLEHTYDARREVFWIERLRAQGCDLTNGTAGGISGYFHSPQARAKIAEAGQKRFKDLSGQTVGRLKVLEVASHQPLCWKCLCSCGREVAVKAQSFSARRVQSCGCLSREGSAQRARNRARHGMWQSREYLTWRDMRACCNKPNHVRYNCNGAKGIRVCPEWQTSFEQFFANMGVKPENYVLMRKDLTKDYNPQNCVWATKSELRRQTR